MGDTKKLAILLAQMLNENIGAPPISTKTLKDGRRDIEESIQFLLNQPTKPINIAVLFTWMEYRKYSAFVQNLKPSVNPAKTPQNIQKSF